MPKIDKTQKENVNPLTSEPIVSARMLFVKYTDIGVPNTTARITVPKKDVARITPPDDHPTKLITLPFCIVSFDYAFWSGKVLDVVTRRIAFLPPDTWQKWVDSKTLRTFDTFQAPRLNHQHVVFCPVRVAVEWALAVVIRPCMLGGRKEVMEGDEATPYAVRAKAQEECNFQDPLVLVLCREPFNRLAFTPTFKKFLEHFVSPDDKGAVKTISFCYRQVSLGA